MYNPQVGFTLVGNTAHPSKYPYNPFYGEWSPRIAAAWDVFGDGRTVIRGGYGRTYGRLNGVDLVLVPLLGTGLIQAVQCTRRFATELAAARQRQPEHRVPRRYRRTDGAAAASQPNPSATVLSRRERGCRGSRRGA